jgi:hypothetical protein
MKNMTETKTVTIQLSDEDWEYLQAEAKRTQSNFDDLASNLLRERIAQVKLQKYRREAHQQREIERLQPPLKPDLDVPNPSPEDFIQAIRNALESGDFYKAQRLSIQALKHYPDHLDIKQCAYVLEPAKSTISRRTDIDRPGLKKSREWVSQQRRNRNYVNQWVAVRNGELLATGQSLDELVDAIDDTNNVLLTVIY